MGQSINLPFVLAKLLYKPRLLIPQMRVADIREINFKHLKSLGFQAVAFDKDNTLTRPYSNAMLPDFKAALDSCVLAFGRENVAIVSNSAGSSDDQDGAQACIVEAELRIPVFRHSKKPKDAFLISEHFKCAPHRVIVIGDRMFTDVFYGNQSSAFTILTTNIITVENDNKAASVMRRIEHKLLRVFDYIGFHPYPHPLR
jgi:phosphatidylglycerophosphatase GEP4